MSKFQADAYLRLSYTTDRMEESDSITNQRKLIQDFVAAHPDIELVSERVDDGYSGVLFDRPAFLEMMDDIKAGKINCVIVKDLSRLGRDYIEANRYLQRIFPAFGVRFISINDNIDTENERSGDELTVSIKNIINDTYSHDISVKTRSALKAKRERGDYVGACPVYGYQKDPENRNRLKVDEHSAGIVRDIYRRRIEGVSAKKIADELNHMGILSPLAFKISRGLPHPSGGFADSPDAKWSAQAVIRILQDETYTGVLVQGKQTTHNHKLKALVNNPASEWVRTENAHEAIISRRDFELVQKISQLDTRTAPDGESVYLFSGLLICGSCGGRMTRKIYSRNDKRYVYYRCPAGKKNGCFHPVMVREDDLTACVLEGLQAHIRNVTSLETLLSSIDEERLNQQAVLGLREQIKDNELQMERALRFRTSLYENLMNGFLTKEEYRYSKNKYNGDIQRAQEAIERLRQEIDDVSNSAAERQKWVHHFKQFANMTELDRRAVITMIDAIRVTGKEGLDIQFRFQMEYETARQKASLLASTLEKEAV